MAESLLLPVVRGVVGKAADALVQSITRMWGVDNDRLKLERHLVYVQSLLADAEAKSETNHAVRTWMKELKAAAYQADDVLDDFQYEALRREALSGQSTASKVLSNFTSKNRLVFRHKASRDLKNVLEKIDELVTEMTKFGLVALAEAPLQALPRQTHSALDESREIIGRKDDKDGVVELLLNQQDRRDVQVLPILGMGGVGKTTLAKMVYNNDKIQKHFELRMWHCVSENFEAIPLVRSVIELATNSTCGLPDTIELLRGKLQEAIGRKRFLLILDDVWNEDQNKWEDDLRPLLCSSIGGSGSTIVVTSRSRQVASIMGTLPPHELVCLSEDDSWKLFSNKAFSKGVQEQAEFVKIGRCISKKCKGLPLALKTMGGLMSSKQQIQEWEAIADCNISDTNRGKDEVLPILKLSYKYLSPEMKQCFAFCSVFPKDYEMEKDMLIQLWMANGYLCEEGTMDLTQKGEYVFNELAWRTFFQDVILVREPCWPYFIYASKQEINGCKMHDLMHDLAKDVANECANAEELIQQNLPVNDVRHLHISEYYQLNKISQLLGGTMYLRTLLMPLSSYKDLVKSKLMSSRALRICCGHTPIVHMELTRTAHLRYLDLSGSMIVSLPNSICMLYNLLSLRLNGCSELQYLPEGMRTMRKLCHIYLLGCCRLERMPPKLSVLHNLRTLTTFVVGTKDGCGIEELEDLRQIGGRLELYNLWEVKCGSKANLHEKHNLNELLLYWDHFRDEYDKSTIGEATNHEQVLESLVPHDKLKILEVHSYGGLTISEWMGNPQMFRCLRELIMVFCPWCKDLPIVWLSSSLEHLCLQGMESLTTLCKNIDVEAEADNTSLQIFPKLKRMELIALPELDRWAENSAGEILSSVMFPRLEKLEIENCDKLASLPKLPVLTYLNLSGREGNNSTGALISMPLGSLPSLIHLRISFLLVDVVMPPDGEESQSQRPLDTLRYLKLQGDDAFITIFNKSKLQLGLRDYLVSVEELDIRSLDIVRWPVEELRCFPRLRFLSIWDCSKLEGKSSSSEEDGILPLLPKFPASLEEIWIDNNRSLVALPSNLGDLTKLRRLTVQCCVALKALPDGMDGLTSLDIGYCPGIEKFPQGLQQRLPALKFLYIWGCPDLQRRCREGGEYFDLIASIPHKYIEAPAQAQPRKWFLPSCGGGSQGN
ncbi:hypothetical protein SETIT_6G232200v2 [Setaria italica]|uniref:Uncharacterized protein n=1 Tax=Setaria italica TaxID=4555 RepID=K3YFX0_SETIT|nr:disease resistance protein RGA2 [Setaria italica]XP_012702585.1 disease resistance protein RGA2 [Setaria italica]XP_022683219.1 disease resistance protein RGA2 [Setaria italica]XP_022683220.1 disease resistance protein RGA2 [Setaria italica]RCV32115.1 hypothetical protein SETIT_6G232200v2 [Setaria italica]